MSFTFYNMFLRTFSLRYPSSCYRKTLRSARYTIEPISKSSVIAFTNSSILELRRSCPFFINYFFIFNKIKMIIYFMNLKDSG